MESPSIMTMRPTPARTSASKAPPPTPPTPKRAIEVSFNVLILSGPTNHSKRVNIYSINISPPE